MRKTVLFLLLAIPLWAEPYVAGLRLENSDDALKGELVADELNCVACHTGSDAQRKAAKPGPRLAAVASRLNPHFLEAFIANPHAVRPGTTMPNLLPAAERAESAKQLTHFLLSIGKSDFAPTAHDRFAGEVGKALFHSVGCVACHSPRDDTGAELLTDVSVPLGKLETRYSVRSLSNFLRSSHTIRPGGRMPDMRLNPTEASRIANYLLAKTRVPGQLNYSIWQGKVWEGLDINVEKKHAGHVAAFDLALLGKPGNNSAIKFDGFLKTDVAGEYQFFLEMNGGSLQVNGKLLGEKLQPHHHRGVKKLTLKAQLKAGWNSIEFLYFQMGRNPHLLLEWAGPGFERQAIPSARLSISKEPIPAYEPYPVDEELAAKGREQFAKLGCARCHDDVKQKSPPASGWESLDLAKNCSTADYQLSPSQRQWLQTKPPSAFSAQQQVAKTLLSLNCVACHTRGDLGGLSDARDPYFSSSHPELGDPGRLPPPLTLVGAKLQPDWLRAVLQNGRTQRSYMTTRMPQYGARNVAHLPELFAEVDRVEPVTFAEFADPQPYKDAGLRMMGNTGFTCIACHDFNSQKSAAGGLELLGLSDRVQKDWFYHFMRDPAHFRAGIVMPSFWPGGVAMRKDILGGDSKAQIDAIWTYLLGGTRVRSPQGLSRQSRELRVADQAVICRGRGTPAGYRGIGVGYPSGINLVFDSEQMNLMFLWKGEFASSDNGRFSMRGSDRVQFAPGIPFHRLPDGDALWPYKRKTDYLFPGDHGYQYRGYFLDAAKRPTFMYEYDELKIEDFFMDGPHGFTRTLTFVAKSATTFQFRAATAAKIAKKGTGQFQVDRLELRSSQDAEVRQAELQELLIPLELPAGKSTLTLEYRW
ncbi:MAG: mono/diheme cytochrome c family protein [Rhodothermales bacterium]|jgi:mono/diheme cytochrome c family protein